MWRYGQPSSYATAPLGFTGRVGWCCRTAKWAHKVLMGRWALKVKSWMTLQNHSFYVHGLLNTDPIKPEDWLIFDSFPGSKHKDGIARYVVSLLPSPSRTLETWLEWDPTPCLTAMATSAVLLECDALATVCSGPNCLVPPDNFNQILSLAMSTTLTIMLAMVMFSMGCTVDAAKLWGHVRRPWGIFIGFLCQFGIMPFTAFALALAFQVIPVQAVVIIIMGCCPGGTGSNIICYWLDGDMDLR